MKLKKRNLTRKKNGARFDPEERIGALIKSGAIASAGRNAIAASFKKGLSVTILENNIIYRMHPDGTKTAIKKITPLTQTFTKGEIFIK